jgi:hypothetical protein
VAARAPPAPALAARRAKRRIERREPACKPGSVVDNHSSGTRVAARLKRPTRGHARAARRGTQGRSSPYLVLLRVGFTLPPMLPPARCALTAPFHPYLPAGGRAAGRDRRYLFCGTFRGLAPPRRYLAPCPAEPGLSSPPARGKSGCPADSRAHSLSEIDPRHRGDRPTLRRAIAPAQGASPAPRSRSSPSR